MTDSEQWREAAFARLRRTDLQVSLVYGALVWFAILVLPRWWAFGWIVFFGFFYVRMHQVIMRREEELDDPSTPIFSHGSQQSSRDGTSNRARIKSDAGQGDQARERFRHS